ncbi:MAG: hypothetical protein IPP71_03855 [Bacteroidetes bacterium]|nr:hypothetical protein [Bacteroidota bacterium]
MIGIKIFRSLFYFILAAVGLFVGLQLSFTFYFNAKIKTELQTAISNQTKGEYKIEIGNLGINIFTQSIYITDFLIKPEYHGTISAPKYFVRAAQVNFINIGIISLVAKKDLIISSIEVVEPSGYIYRNSNRSGKSLADSVSHFSIYDLLKSSIHAVEVATIEIDNADIRIYDDYRDSIPAIMSKQNELRVSNIKIDSTVDAAGKLFMAEKVNLVINQFSYTTKDSLYSFHVNKLVTSYTEGALLIDSLEVLPNYSKLKFAHHAGQQTDRIKIYAASLKFSEMDVKLFFERNWFIAKNLEIDKLFISAYRDKNDSRIPNRPKSVQALLKSIPIYAAIDSIHLKGSDIIYEEVAEGGTSPGRISFTKVAATISGFTSDTTLFSKYNSLVVKAQGKFMNVGKIDVEYVFPLNTDEMVFDCSGKLLDMPMAAINPMLEPNANVTMKSGKIDAMFFSFHANDDFAKGKMKFIYHNLKLDFLNKKEKKSGPVEDVLAFLVHKLIIKENNPSQNESIRITEINNPRHKGRFIFNYTWKSLLSGIKPAIGLPERLSRPLKK